MPLWPKPSSPSTLPTWIPSAEAEAAAAVEEAVVVLVAVAPAAEVVVRMHPVVELLPPNELFRTLPHQFLQHLPQSNLLQLHNTVSLPPSTLTPNCLPTLMTMQISYRPTET